MFNEYAQYYELFNKDKQYKKEIDFVYKWANKPKLIEDFGCGTAHYWKYYPKSVDIHGIEKSAEMRERSKYKNQIYLINRETPIKEVDLVTALFDVINYIPSQSWWGDITLKKGGYFIFDIWDKEKVDKDGFSWTEKTVKGITRKISPLAYNGKTVDFGIEIKDGESIFVECHRMYVWSHKDIERFCGKEFIIDEVKKTKKWQTWYRLKRK